jgi:hypothetical protein
MRLVSGLRCGLEAGIEEYLDWMKGHKPEKS